MNQDEFIDRVKDKYKKTNNDHLLISCMTSIKDYFNELSSKISDIDGHLAVGFDHSKADFINVDLIDNHFHIKRLDDHITINFVSGKDNEYTDKYSHLEIDRIVIKDGVLFSKTSGTEFSVDILDNYLKYLLA